MNTPVTDKDMNTLDNAAFRTEVRTWIEARQNCATRRCACI